MAARNAKHSISMILRKNRGLRTVYDGISDSNIDYVKVKENCVYRHFTFFKSYEVPNKLRVVQYCRPESKNELCFLCTVLVSTHRFKNEFCCLLGLPVST